jgi:hypothetical protein
MSTLDEPVPKVVAVSADSSLAATAKLGRRAADSPPASFRVLLISLSSAAIGLVAGTVAGVMAARLRGFNDEHLREPGWFSRTRPVRSEKLDHRPARIPGSRAGKRESALHSPKVKFLA